MLLLLCLLIELGHVLAHVAVLSGRYSIKHKSNFDRVLYFFFDLVTSLASYYLTGKNGLLVSVHALIHVCALVQLLCPYSLFWSNVFRLAEQRVDEQDPKIPFWHKLVYFIGTVVDIVTHLANTVFLILTI
jgi:hypothetical protein